MARQALEMALGRGGDQVAIKSGAALPFMAGPQKGWKNRYQGQNPQSWLQALSELIGTAENVLIMGHQFADLDCLGSAVGMYKAVRQMGKPAAVVLNRQRNLAFPLYNRLAQNGYADAFVEPDLAIDLIGKKTLLVVVDTHLPHILESREVYSACKNGSGDRPSPENGGAYRQCGDFLS